MSRAESDSIANIARVHVLVDNELYDVVCVLLQEDDESVVCSLCYSPWSSPRTPRLEEQAVQRRPSWGRPPPATLSSPSAFISLLLPPARWPGPWDKHRVAPLQFCRENTRGQLMAAADISKGSDPVRYQPGLGNLARKSVILSSS